MGDLFFNFCSPEKQTFGRFALIDNWIFSTVVILVSEGVFQDSFHLDAMIIITV